MSQAAPSSSAPIAARARAGARTAAGHLRRIGGPLLVAAFAISLALHGLLLLILVVRPQGLMGRPPVREKL